ncbi:hypothetical protein GCM10018779_66780 [Streptomyces griseocarneus]|nr:hypothetical protein GCM10018779_66780 [Streptomyces griseocarneus]
MRAGLPPSSTCTVPYAPARRADAHRTKVVEVRWMPHHAHEIDLYIFRGNRYLGQAFLSDDGWQGRAQRSPAPGPETIRGTQAGPLPARHRACSACPGDT